jgi:hypothetical protein
MLIRLAVILITCSFIGRTQAQDFFVDVPKKKRDDFAKSFVRLINDAPYYFKDVKDKAFKGIDSLNPSSKPFHCKAKLQGAVSSRIIYDSIPFAEYHFGDFDNMEDGETALVNLSNNIAEAMGRKVMFRNNDTGSNTGMLRQTKIAYTQQSGFFHYNVFVQLFKKEGEEKYRVLLKVKGGRPPYYYKVMKTEPIGSFMFATALRSQVGTFQKYKPQGCLGDLTPFQCRGTRKCGDTIVVVYTKYGFQDLLDGKKEFEITLTNLRTCLSEEYVYYLPPPINNRMREVAFLRVDDIEKKRSKTIHLSLVEQSKNEYYLELGFVY